MADFDVDEFLKKRTPETVGETPDSFDPDAFLARRSQFDTAPSGEEASAMLAAPAVTGAAYALPAAGAGAAAQRIGMAAAKPAIESAKGLYQAYRANPLGAVADAALVGTGNFPVFGPVSASSSGVKGLYDRYIKPLKGAATEASIAASEGGQATKEAYRAIKEAAPKSFGEAMRSAYAAGGNNAVGQLLRSPEGQQVLNAAGQAANAEKYLSAIPSAAKQVGAALKPLAVGAARVLGPAGLAYDTYEAVDLLKQGQKIAPPVTPAGTIMAQTRRAQLNAPTPAPLTPQEASNLLASGDERTINIYGGRERLQSIMRGAVQQQALNRVMGPVAPGQ